MGDNNEMTPAVQDGALDNKYSAAQTVLAYIKYLEGYRIRLREMHWAALKSNMHKNTDDLMSFLEGKEDAIAEDAQGLLGFRIQVGDVVPTMPSTGKDFTALLDEILSVTVSTKNMLSSASDDRMAGLLSLFDEIIHEVSKMIYLNGMD